MDRGRASDDEAENVLFKMISGREDDGSQYLNDSGEGIMEELDRNDECQTNSGVGPLTKSGEVYIN
jgi:hypothetical protein